MFKELALYYKAYKLLKQNQTVVLRVFVKKHNNSPTPHLIRIITPNGVCKFTYFLYIPRPINTEFKLRLERHNTLAYDVSCFLTKYILMTPENEIVYNKGIMWTLLCMWKYDTKRHEINEVLTLNEYKVKLNQDSKYY